MASKGGSKPLISGGRTLSKMRRGSKGSSGGGKKNRKATWFQVGTDVDNTQAKLGSWPTGEIPPKVLERINKNK